MDGERKWEDTGIEPLLAALLAQSALGGKPHCWLVGSFWLLAACNELLILLLTPNEKADLLVGLFIWSEQRESNPHNQLGKLEFCH